MGIKERAFLMLIAGPLLVSLCVYIAIIWECKSIYTILVVNVLTVCTYSHREARLSTAAHSLLNMYVFSWTPLFTFRQSADYMCRRASKLINSNAENGSIALSLLSLLLLLRCLVIDGGGGEGGEGRRGGGGEDVD